jgi:hypothetical protein
MSGDKVRTPSSNDRLAIILPEEEKETFGEFATSNISDVSIPFLVRYRNR